MDKKNILEIKNLAKSYDNNNEKVVQVFKDLNITFEKQKIHCLLGVSGSGKSSLLRMISGLEAPDSGTVEFADDSVKSKFYMIFQSNNLFPWKTVYENIYLVLKAYYKNNKKKLDKKQMQEKIEGVLSKYDLLQYKDFYPYELSGGLGQKVTLVKALITEPPLLLFDESFSALDFISKEMVHEFLLSDFDNNKYSAIISTHDIHEAIKLGDFIHIINRDFYIKIKNPLVRPRLEDSGFEKFYNKIKTSYKEEI